MELHDIRYFLALSRALTFTKAAEACGVSQPTLSRAIHKMEDELVLAVHDVVLVIFRFGMATDGDDGTLNSGRAALGFGLLNRIVIAFVIGLNDRSFVLGTDLAAIGQELAVMVDADEHAGAGDVGLIEDLEPGLEGLERRLDLAEPLVDLVGQLVGIPILRLELVVLGAQRLARGPLLVGEIGRHAVELAQAMVMAIGKFDFHGRRSIRTRSSSEHSPRTSMSTQRPARPTSCLSSRGRLTTKTSGYCCFAEGNTPWR